LYNFLDIWSSSCCVTFPNSKRSRSAWK